jgi:hypothetical protein
MPRYYIIVVIFLLYSCCDAFFSHKYAKSVENKPKYCCTMKNPIEISSSTSKLVNSLLLTSILTILPCSLAARADEVGNIGEYESTAATKTSSKMNMATFLTQLESGSFNRVVFKGINPKYLEAYTKNGDMYLVEEGFPSYDDPKSPSGPAQVIAKVQHTPNVICQQDISDAMSKLAAKSQAYEMRPMLSHNPYPKEFEYKP